MDDVRHKNLERDLKQMAASLTYPPTPDVARRVVQRLQTGTEAVEQRRTLLPSLPRQPLSRPSLAALAVLTLLSGVVVAAYPPSRTAIADFFGLRQVQVTVLDDAPVSRGTEIAGTPVSLQGAQSLAGFTVRLPTYPEGIGEPDRVLFQQFSERKGVVLIYERPGATFTLLQTPGMIGKSLFMEATVEPVTVDDTTGLWLQGQRVVSYLDQYGRPIEESQRVTDVNTLIWENDGILFRLEGNLSREEAVRIARSLRVQ